jgi:hypothetical protein
MNLDATGDERHPDGPSTGIGIMTVGPRPAGMITGIGDVTVDLHPEGMITGIESMMITTMTITTIIMRTTIADIATIN